MIDERFYDIMPPRNAGDISLLVGGFCVGDDKKIISNVAALDVAQEDALTYCENWHTDGFIQTNAGIIITNKSNQEKIPNNATAIIVDAPRFAFSKFASGFITEKVTIDDKRTNCVFEDNLKIAASAIIGENVQIGANTIIGAHSVISDGVTIGRNCNIGAGVTISCAYIGDNVRIGANSVIGKAGFGVTGSSEGLIDVPQLGRVIIQDKVSIGALCTVDRGAFGDTIIGMMTKIDNHSHIAHNVHIGKGVVMAAFAGISGSVEIGDYVMMGGRVGIGDHFKIGAGAKLAAGAAVLSDVPAGETYAGYPAKPKTKFLRETIALSKLIKNSGFGLRKDKK